MIQILLKLIPQCNKRKVQCNNWASIELKPAYTKQIPISDAKKKDILYLLEKKNHTDRLCTLY